MIVAPPTRARARLHRSAAALAPTTIFPSAFRVLLSISGREYAPFPARRHRPPATPRPCPCLCPPQTPPPSSPEVPQAAAPRLRLEVHSPLQASRDASQKIIVVNEGNCCRAIGTPRRARELKRRVASLPDDTCSAAHACSPTAQIAAGIGGAIVLIKKKCDEDKDRVAQVDERGSSHGAGAKAWCLLIHAEASLSRALSISLCAG